MAVRKRLGGEPLDEVYAEDLSKASEFCSGQRASLAVDGWSTVQRDPVLGVSLTVGRRTFLVNTIDTTGVPHTAEISADIVLKEMERVEAEFGVKLVCVATDNASNMVKMRELIHQVKLDLDVLHNFIFSLFLCRQDGCQ